MVDSEPLQTVELSIEECIDFEQPSMTKTRKAQSASTEGDTADSLGATEENLVEEEAVDTLLLIIQCRGPLGQGTHPFDTDWPIPTLQ